MPIPYVGYYPPLVSKGDTDWANLNIALLNAAGRGISSGVRQIQKSLSGYEDPGFRGMYSKPPIGRIPPSNASGESYRDQELRLSAAARAAAGPSAGGGLGGGNAASSVPIVTGTRDGVTPNRPQSDEYRAWIGQQSAPAFPLTPQGQFQSYQSPKWDQYFGAASRAQFPASLQAMQQLAAQPTAPGTTPADLATYYRAQSATGRGNMGEIVSGLTQGLQGKEAENMKAWATANPMLADRLYNKRFPGGVGQQSLGQQAQNVNVPVTAAFNREPLAQGAQFPQPDVSGAFGNSNLLGGVNPFTTPALAGGSAPHGMDTNTLYGREAPNFVALNLPGGAMTQGMNVSNQFNEAANKAAAFTNPQNFASQGAESVGERVSRFLDLQKAFGNVR